MRYLSQYLRELRDHSGYTSRRRFLTEIHLSRNSISAIERQVTFDKILFYWLIFYEIPLNELFRDIQ